MKSVDKTSPYILASFLLLAAVIIAYVLILPPQPGVADQGDFDRVMSVAGLELMPEHYNSSDYGRFFDYTITEYKISAASIWNVLAILKATTMTCLITIITIIVTLLGQDIFKTGYLAIAYALIYIFSLSVIIKCLNIGNRFKAAIFMVAALLILLDGNYLIWFNSLYGEPMMITTLMLFIAAWVYYLYHRYALESTGDAFNRVLLIFGAAFLFLGSKMQVISAFPIILLMLAKLGWDNRHQFQIWQACILGCVGLVVLIYPPLLIFQDQEINQFRQYNSVFYGILKDSPTPSQDLVNLGLNPDMAVEAGKHAFLDEGEYVRYVPGSAITEHEFHSKISSTRLIAFYITHPGRLITGMKYTANQAFVTSTWLGKYPREYDQIPIREFDRFTLWSSFREQYFPKNLAFFITVYAVVGITSLRIYLRSDRSQGTKAGIRLLGAIILIGLAQFPMPYLGNGQADTAKQLYLFNFVFDLVLVVSISWCMGQLIDARRFLTKDPAISAPIMPTSGKRNAV